MAGVAAREAGTFFAIPLEHLETETVLGFDLFLRHGRGEPVLYRGQNMEFTPAVKERLIASGVRELLVPSDQAQAYARYRDEHGGDEQGPAPKETGLGGLSADEQELPELLADAAVPLEVRSNVLIGVSHAIIEAALADLGQPGLPQRIQRISEETARYLLAEPCAFASMVDLLAVDSTTYNHMANTSLYSLELARAAGYDDLSDLSALGRAALLHDVGKADLPVELLRRDGNLSDLEYAELMNHTHLGVQRLRDAGWDDPLCLDVCASHHERCDRSGWPRGLSRDQISLPSRIVAIADTFDTLTTNHGAGFGLTGYQALWKIKREMRGQFDPELLDRFIQVMVDPRRHR